MLHCRPADPVAPERGRRRPSIGARVASSLVGLWTKVEPTNALEGSLIFSVLLVIEWVTPGPAILAHLSPHPFWIPVILMSVQKGSASGLAAAGLATGLAWVAGWPAQTSQEDFYTYSLRIWREPILWIIAALVIGARRNRQIRDRQALEDRLRLTEEQRNTLGSYCDELHAELADFERERATALNCPVEFALEALYNLRAQTTPDWSEDLRAAMACWLGPAQWTLHLLRSGVLYPAVATAGGLQESNQALARLHAAALGLKRPICVFERWDAALLDGIGILACAVQVPGRSAGLGLLVVSQVEPSRLSKAMPAAVDAIADALGIRLAKIPFDAGSRHRPDEPFGFPAVPSEDRIPCVS